MTLIGVPEQLYIGGYFDILHQDHRSFIEAGIAQFTKKYGCLNKVIIGLVSDATISKNKGVSRPFYSFEWRKNDMENFLTSQSIPFEIIDRAECVPQKVSPDKTIVQISSSYLEGILKMNAVGYEVMAIDPIDTCHTTDIEARLMFNASQSRCNLRKVGVLLLRKGQLVAEGYSGDGDCNNCEKYLAYKTGRGIMSKNVLCDYPHAEEYCISKAKEGDDLIVTDSPCDRCAQLIVENGHIRRIVYLAEWHRTEPLDYIRSHNILVRKAGV